MLFLLPSICLLSPFWTTSNYILKVSFLLLVNSFGSSILVLFFLLFSTIYIYFCDSIPQDLYVSPSLEVPMQWEPTLVAFTSPSLSLPRNGVPFTGNKKEEKREYIRNRKGGKFLLVLFLSPLRFPFSSYSPLLLKNKKI